MTKIDSWVDIPENSDFSIYNLPYGVFQFENNNPTIGVAIGNQILDLKQVSEKGLFDDLGFTKNPFSENTLNNFIKSGKQTWSRTRKRIQELLTKGNTEIQNAGIELIQQSDVKMLLPIQIGDYTDFYSSEDHARNVGKMFRDPENALLPNWKHLPVGYHGRASSIVVSGTDIYRPKGQIMPLNADKPFFGTSQRMDFELEMAFITGQGPELGNSISTKNAEDYIFGLTIFNDWSARDIQKWEYVPLGPFLGKSFASSMSPWIVTLEALEYFRTAGPIQEPEVLPYLKYNGKKHIDLNLEVIIQTENHEKNTVSNSNFKYMYWNMAQQLAHHTCNGCNINAGDVMASGTISGPKKGSYGSMLEIAWAGKNPITLKDGSQRKFIHDNDTVIMKAFAEKEGFRVGFGEVKGKILPAKK